jgi:hypothetical protein
MPAITLAVVEVAPNVSVALAAPRHCWSHRGGEITGFEVILARDREVDRPGRPCPVALDRSGERGCLRQRPARSGRETAIRAATPAPGRRPPVPAGLGSLTAPQRVMADFLRVDPDLLAVAAQASPEVTQDPGALAAHIAGMPGGEKDGLLMLVGRDQAAWAKMELLRGVRGYPDEGRAARPVRTVADLLDAAAELCRERRRQAEAEAAAREALREQQSEAAGHSHQHLLRLDIPN